MRKFLALLKKELLQFLKNPKSRMAVFTPPITQLVFLGYAATMDLKDVPMACLDRANTSESRQIVSDFAANGTFHLVKVCENEEELKESLSYRQAKLALYIPENFPRSREVGIFLDGRNSYSGGTAFGYAQDILQNGAIQGPLVATRGYFNPEFDPQHFMVPCLLAVLVLLALTLLVALALAREKEAGTYDQLRLTPYGSLTVLAAKGLAGALIGYCQLIICLLFILLWFKIPLTGSWAGLAALLTCFVICAVGLGLAMSCFCSNMQQAMITTFMFSVPFVMLSGLATPVASMPQWLRTLVLFNPLRWSVEALQRLFLEGASLMDVLPICGILFLIGLFAFSLALLRYGRR